MTSFLSLNVSEIFDNMSHFRFLHNMRKRRISSKLLKWVKNFLKDRSITLIIERYTQTKCRINVNISQDFSFFSILYLFYNADLLKTCENVKLRLSVTGFVNDINILTYSEFTKRNCEMLKKAWNKILEWTKRHKFKFNERKHELIHFSKTSKKYNMKISIALKKHQINASIDFRILKIQLNFKLRWRSHLRQIEMKLINKHSVVSMIENFTWNISLIISRQKYIVIEKSIIVHDVVVWYTSSNIKNSRKKIVFKLKII